MSEASDTEDPDGWDRFARTPSLGAHRSHVAALFDGAISLDAAEALARRARFAERLSRLLVRRHGLADIETPCEPADRAVALLPFDELADLGRRAGAVCWADAIAREIRAAEVGALRQALGDDAYRAALDAREEALSPAALGLDGATDAPPTRETIVAGAEQSGRRCLAGWLAAAPKGVADRVRLRLPLGDAEVEVGEVYAEAGPRIVRRLAA